MEVSIFNLFTIWVSLRSQDDRFTRQRAQNPMKAIAADTTPSWS
jgi:hypothetical protein